ncbi:non-receptor serine/threonine protein kinase [Lithospermum erythrorhizon]|uniref:Non-receptor serine/threonine protein kinase n=1 Tax=Lithospermum erythrorhizon TaxID=34254 RepID=A0AAV3NY84_LITER
MGGLCSKESGVHDYVADNEKDGKSKCFKQVIAPPKRKKFAKPTKDVSANTISESTAETKNSRGEGSASGWPRWLSSVAGDAIKGWLPRSADSYQKISKIGQGTYSTVYRARDLITNKIVAMKKVNFVNMDPESVRFMAREISILRRLDHPNVMKLEALVTSRISGSLYLVFEYMEHDLTGLLASPKVKFTEPQIKCFMQQLLRGLEHGHSRGVLHRDIKGSNVLVDNNGNLKIGDWGLATTYEPHQTEPMTSRVVSLWYRAPELLLGATEYGPAIDMWSVGCILAELFRGKPIMPGRTEVEQMHKIFKLCGSASEDYWRNSNLPHATSFKPQQPYKRRVTDTFKDLPPAALKLVNVLLSMEPNLRRDATSALNSEFFKTKPLPCDPSSLPKYPPSKELDVKLQKEGARRRKDESVKGNGKISSTKSSRSAKVTPINQKQSTSVKITPWEESGTGFPIEASRMGLHHSVGYGWAPKAKRHSSSSVHGRSLSSSQRQRGARQSSSLHISDKNGSAQDSSVYVPKVNRIHFSGPLVPPGGNMEELLKEHERQIQEAVRKGRHVKNKTTKNMLY